MPAHIYNHICITKTLVDIQSRAETFMSKWHLPVLQLRKVAVRGGKIGRSLAIIVVSIVHSMDKCPLCDKDS